MEKKSKTIKKPAIKAIAGLIEKVIIHLH